MAEEDLIFGKKRHFFGGIEPSNMLAFNVFAENGVAKVTATLPADTVVDGQVLCSVEGAVIRRKTTGYPKDEFDGTLVADIKASTTLVDSGVTVTGNSITGTYYYSAFPYTTQGVYNRNKANRLVINEPKPMKEFFAKYVCDHMTDSVTVNITAKLPAGVAGAVIRRSTTGYPVSETDGEQFKTITTDGVYQDTNVVIGAVYYYSAFPYNKTGAHNYSEINRTSVTPRKATYVFGYDLVEIDSNSENRVIYPSLVDNTSYVPVSMNLDTGVIEYGSWYSLEDTFMPRPCMLTYDGKVDHYLNPDDYTKKIDGTKSKIDDISFDGNAMMEWPKIFTKRWVENGLYKFRCSDVPNDDTWDCLCNYDRNNNQIDHFYTSIYLGSNVSDKLRSISGQTIFTGTVENKINYAKANGADWYIEVLADRLLIQDLLVMMAKSTECQTAYGYGSCINNNPISDQGTMNDKGLFYGRNAENLDNGVKVFGMENWWGNLWRHVAGYMYVEGIQKVKLTRGTHDGSAASDYNTDGSGYISVPNSSITGENGGYISTMLKMPYGRLPSDVSGSSRTYEADTAFFDNKVAGYALFGGSSLSNMSAGPFNVMLNRQADDSTPNVFGAALSCKPQQTE